MRKQKKQKERRRRRRREEEDKEKEEKEEDFENLSDLELVYKIGKPAGAPESRSKASHLARSVRSVYD